MQSRTRYRITPDDPTTCGLEPFINSLTQCPLELRANLLWAFAFQLPGVARDDRLATFSHLLKAIKRLPPVLRSDPLAELGLHISDLPTSDQPRAFHEFAAVVTEISVEWQVDLLAELASSIVAKAYPPAQAMPERDFPH